MVKNVVGTKRKRRLEWPQDGEVALLKLWEERVTELRETLKTKPIYAEMSVELAKLGFPHSARDIQVKVQNFKQRYRKEKLMVAEPGGSPSKWSHYKRVHKIIDRLNANESKQKNLDESCIIASKSSWSTPLASLTTPISSPSSPIARSPIALKYSPASRSSPPTRSSPVPSPPPSPEPTTSAAVLEAERMMLTSHFQEQLLQKLDKLSSDIADHFVKSNENQKKLIEIEKRKAKSLETLLRILSKD